MNLGRFNYLLHILKNLLRFVKYFQKKLSLGIYAPTENPQTFEKGGTLGNTTWDFRFWIVKNALYSSIRCWLLGYGLYTHFL